MFDGAVMYDVVSNTYFTVLWSNVNFCKPPDPPQCCYKICISMVCMSHMGVHTAVIGVGMHKKLWVWQEGLEVLYDGAVILCVLREVVVSNTYLR